MYLQKKYDYNYNKYINNEIKPLLITKKGICVKVDRKNLHVLRPLFSYFILKTKNYVLNRTITFQSYTEEYDSEKKILKCWFPRFGFLELLISDTFMNDTIRSALKKINYNIVVLNKLKLPPKIAAIDAEIDLTEIQIVVVDYIMENYFNEYKMKRGASGVNVVLSTGKGKSYIAAEVINRLKLPTIIIYNTTILLKQMYDLLVSIFGEEMVGVYYGEEQNLEPPIIVALIQYVILHPPDKKFGLTIYDESHLYCSNAAIKCFGFCNR